MWWKALIILVLSAAIFGAAAFFGYDIFIRPRKVANVEAAMPSPTPPPDPALPLIAQAKKLKEEGKWSEARAAFESLLANYSNSSEVGTIKRELGDINTHLFFSSKPGPGKEEYVVKPGDALAKIERRFKTTGEVIMKINNLEDPTKLAIGQRLMIVHPEAALLLDRSAKTITLLDHGAFFKEYRATSWTAPPGKLKGPQQAKVTEKIAWRDGARVSFGQKEFLGSLRWVSLSIPGYTIYAEPPAGDEKATKPPTGIAVSPEESEEIATMVRTGTPVTIQ